MSAAHPSSSITEFDELAIRQQAAALRSAMFRRFVTRAWTLLKIVPPAGARRTVRPTPDPHQIGTISRRAGASSA